MIRALRSGDWAAWSTLWNDYLRFYRVELDADTTALTFKRLCDRTAGMLGLLATDEHGDAVGLAHIVFHASTWSASDYCYLEDLFVAKAARGGKIARELISAVYEQADEAGAKRVYWHTQEFNAPARSLYDQVAHRSSFVVYTR
ncbi:MAG: GNAT family N-acetyltransferase [Solirubrobacteraceae bacterium]